MMKKKRGRGEKGGKRGGHNWVTFIFTFNNSEALRARENLREHSHFELGLTFHILKMEIMTE